MAVGCLRKPGIFLMHGMGNIRLSRKPSGSFPLFSSALLQGFQNMLPWPVWGLFSTCPGGSTAFAATMLSKASFYMPTQFTTFQETARTPSLLCFHPGITSQDTVLLYTMTFSGKSLLRTWVHDGIHHLYLHSSSTAQFVHTLLNDTPLFNCLGCQIKYFIILAWILSFFYGYTNEWFPCRQGYAFLFL